MTDQIAIQLPRLSYREGSAFTATAYFRDRTTAAAATPTSVKYRLDCLTTDTELLDWTTVTPAANISLSITAAQQAIQDESNRTETKQLTISADHDLSTQVRETAIWDVTNIARV